MVIYIDTLSFIYIDKMLCILNDLKKEKHLFTEIFASSIFAAY